MHACGHDGHTTILLGAVYHLWKYKSNMKGLVRCIFQRGEEAEGAAKEMIDLGVLENSDIEIVVALHFCPNLPLVAIVLKTGALTDSYDDFDLEDSGDAGDGV